MYSTFARTTTPDRAIDFTGTWENDLGSRMTIEIDGTGRVEGSFLAAAGGSWERFDLVGFAAGDLLSFTVNLGRYGSLAAWVGQHTMDEKGELLQSMWLLARDVPDPVEPRKLWSATLTGANQFRRTA